MQAGARRWVSESRVGEAGRGQSGVTVQTASAVIGRKPLGSDSGLQDRHAPSLFLSFSLGKRRISALPSLRFLQSHLCGINSLL